MGYGQYSAGGGLNRTKVEMLESLRGFDLDETTARKGGKNRLIVSTRAGARLFVLHETVVATLSPEGDRLELADGGWPTPTTRSAWGDAVGAFGLKWLQVWTASDWHSDGGYWSARWDTPRKDERSVVYHVKDGVITGRAEAVADLPMIRASTDTGNFAVRYDAAAREVISDAGERVRATPFKTLVTLYRIDKLAKAACGYITMRGNALYQFGFDALGYRVHPGQTSRTVMIGCHTFKTDQIRATLKRIAAEHPEAAKKAKAFVRRHPVDYGVAAYEADLAARAATIRREIAARYAAAPVRALREGRAA